LVVYGDAVRAPVGRHLADSRDAVAIRFGGRYVSGGGRPLALPNSISRRAPTLETLIECTAPYWFMDRVLKLERRSPWPFVIVSALIMVLLHPLTPIVILMAFITGCFLAYVYAHFAPRSQWKAFLHAALFHAAINLVGWTMLLVGPAI
jgi:hypothetical protein